MPRIPFETALDFANKEKITHLLYPLFVHNIGTLLYQPANQTRTRTFSDALEPDRMMKESLTLRLERFGQHHHHSSDDSIEGCLPDSHSFAPHHNISRLGLDHSHTLPTPPTIIISDMGSMDDPNGTFEWDAQGKAKNKTIPLSVETDLKTFNSIPKNSNTTPPSTSPAIQSLIKFKLEGFEPLIFELLPLEKPGIIINQGIKETQNVIETSLEISAADASSLEEPRRKRRKRRKVL